jgi:hypothetical protein
VKLAGRFHFVHSCPSSTYEDIQALMASEKSVELATFRSAIGLKQWREIRDNLGYDRHLSISKDWHVRYYKGVYRHVPAYFLRHSRIEFIFTLGGEVGPSHSEDL